MMWWDIVLSGRVMVVDKSSRGESKVNERKENIGEGSNLIQQSVVNSLLRYWWGLPTGGH